MKGAPPGDDEGPGLGDDEWDEFMLAMDRDPLTGARLPDPRGRLLALADEMAATWQREYHCCVATRHGGKHNADCPLLAYVTAREAYLKTPGREA